MSEHYRALTRKYRPRTFDDIVSQEHVSSTLKNAIQNNRLAHAYMFCGPRGVGKTTMARVLARTINNIDDEVDGEQLSQTLNVVEIDAASNNKVEDVHHLRESVRIPPQNGRYKVFIIDEVHMLSKSAFNALLKTLEEPPDHAIFIFATTEPHKVLPTILSRVQRFDFRRIRVEEMVEHLRKIASREQIHIDNESLHVIAKKADGALRDALGLMDQAIAFCGTTISHDELIRALNVVSTDRMFAFMKAVKTHDAEAGLKLIDELLQEGYDIQEFLIGLTEHLRNLYIARSTQQHQLIEASEETRKRYRQTAQDYSQEDLMRMLHIVSEAQFKIKEAHQPRIQFEVTLLKLIHMQRTETLQQLITGLEALKKKLKNGESLELNGPSATEAPTATGDEENSPQPVSSKAEEQSAVEPSQTTEPAFDSESSPSADTAQPAEASQDSPDSAKPAEDTPKEQPEPTSASVEEDDDDEIEEDEDDSDHIDFFGSPSLNKYSENSPGPAPSPQTKQDHTNGNAATATRQQKPARLTLSEVKEMWPRFVDQIREQVPQMLYFQLQRMQPIELKKHQLTLQCSDAFGQQMIEENRTMLRREFKRFTGTSLQLACQIRQEDEAQKRSRSPYERFKKLQQKDPIIRDIVELFGAELEY